MQMWHRLSQSCETFRFLLSDTFFSSISLTRSALDGGSLEGRSWILHRGWFMSQEERHIRHKNQTDLHKCLVGRRPCSQVVGLCTPPPSSSITTSTHTCTQIIAKFTGRVGWRVGCSWCVSPIRVFDLSIVIGWSGFGCVVTPWTGLSFTDPAHIQRKMSSLSAHK